MKNFIVNWYLKRAANVSMEDVKDVERCIFKTNTLPEYLKASWRLFKMGGMVSYASFAVTQLFRVTLIAWLLSYFTNSTFANAIPNATIITTLIFMVEFVISWKVLLVSRKID